MFNSDDSSDSSDCEVIGYVPNNNEKQKINSVIANLKTEMSNLYKNTIICIEDLVETQDQIMKKIEGVFLTIIKDISQDKQPVLVMRNFRYWHNCGFDEKLYLKSSESTSSLVVKFSENRSRPKFSLITLLLGKIYKLIATQETCTKRELYYQNIEYVESQSLLDSALNHISCLLEAPLHNFNIYSNSKGVIYGPVELITNSSTINCFTNPGVLIPNDVCNIAQINTSATFVLVIEKYAIFQKLIDTNAMDKLPPCIFITGKGFPDVNTRFFLKKIWNVLGIPILAIVDPDPWGIEIMCVYRFGSLALSHQADQLTIPCLRWLGIFPSEINKISDRSSTLTDLDKSKLKDLIRRPYVEANEKIKTEIRYMIDSGQKAETEDIEISLGYLANIYIPRKISCGEFI